MTVEAGVRKYDAKKGGMVQKFHLDPEAWTRGLTRAGAAPGPIATQNYSGSAQYATQNYQAAMQAVTGAYWAERFRAGISR